MGKDHPLLIEVTGSYIDQLGPLIELGTEGFDIAVCRFFFLGKNNRDIVGIITLTKAWNMLGIKDADNLNLLKRGIVGQLVQSNGASLVQPSLTKGLLGGLPEGNHIVTVDDENFFLHLNLLPKYFIHEDSSGHAGVEGLDMPLHRDSNHLIYLLFDIAGDAFAFVADDEG